MCDKKLKTRNLQRFKHLFKALYFVLFCHLLIKLSSNVLSSSNLHDACSYFCFTPLRLYTRLASLCDVADHPTAVPSKEAPEADKGWCPS